MTRKWTPLIVLGLLASAGAHAQDEQPNILWVVVDDLGFTDLGAFGSEIPTPNLDRLAFEGMRLTNLHAAANCQATRLMMMAGTSIANARVPFPEHLEIPAGQRDSELSQDWATIAELLKDAGYQTYMAGKWDLGAYEGSPINRGFDRAYALIGASTNYLGDIMHPVAFEDDGRLFEPVGEFPDGYYSTEHFTDKILEYVQSSDHASPWFAFLSFNAVHWPLQLPEDWLDRHSGRYDAGYDVLREQRVARATELGVIPDGLSLEKFEPIAELWARLSPQEQRRYSRAQEIYAGVVEYVDMSVGRLVDYLEETDQLDNTLIMVMSDHGGSAEESGVTTGRLPSLSRMRADPDVVDNSLGNFGRSGSWIDHGIGFAEAASAPLRQYKATLNEGGLRAASFVRYPGGIPAGGVSHTFVTVMDILPTFLEVAGTKHPGAGEFQGRQINDILGRSFLAHLKGETETVHPPSYTVGWIRGDAAGALIRGDYKIVNDLEMGPTQGPGPGSGSAVGRWRLYNLAEDPGETNDLSSELPELTAELVTEWETNWRQPTR